MKIHWGKAVIIIFIFFISFIVYIVAGSMNAKIDLVTDDYYKKELMYQQTIDKKANARSLNENIELNLNNDQVIISLPSGLKNQHCKGEVFFYRASDKRMDKSFPINTNSGIISVENSFLEKGKWQVFVTFIANNKEYQFTEILFL